MSHVDEGTLHAYLDGALDTLPAAEAERVRRHLTTCDACQARLAEERAVREEAAAILGGTPVDLGDLPSFEEVRARARDHTPAVSAGSRIQRLAWAASVVLALGTGWLLRGGIPQPEPAERFDARESVSAPAAATGVAEELEALPGPTDEPLAQRRAKGAREQDESAVAEEARAVPADAFRDTPAGAAAAAPKVTSDRDALAAADVVGDLAAADSVGRTAEVTAPAELWAAARQRREELERRPAAVPSPAASDAVAAATSFKSVAQEGRGGVAPAMSMMPERADDLASTGGTLVVPGLRVLSVAWLERPELAGAVQVLQLMEDGDTLELVHLPAGVDPGLLPAVGEGRTQVTSPREGGWLIARAKAPEAVLSALLRRLEGGD